MPTAKKSTINSPYLSSKMEVTSSVPFYRSPTLSGQQIILTGESEVHDLHDQRERFSSSVQEISEHHHQGKPTERLPKDATPPPDQIVA